MNHMTIEHPEATAQNRYQKCIDVSKRIRWDIDADVIKGRTFDLADKFLPDGLSHLGTANFLAASDKKFLSQIQGRTYANIFGLAERFINAKILELSADHWFGDQTALEALVRFSDEELKHQELFRRVDHLCAMAMPAGYTFDWNASDIAGVVLGKSTWSVMVLTLHIELFTQTHYRESIDGDETVSPLFKDIFKYHWMEESQHAIIDEMELRRVDAGISAEDRDRGVSDFIELVGAVDGILVGQAQADTRYFVAATQRTVRAEEADKICALMLRAYRWQYILSGAQHKRFQSVMGELITDPQGMRILAALDTLQ